MATRWHTSGSIKLLEENTLLPGVVNFRPCCSVKWRERTQTNVCTKCSSRAHTLSKQLHINSCFHQTKHTPENVTAYVNACLRYTLILGDCVLLLAILSHMSRDIFPHAGSRVVASILLRWRFRIFEEMHRPPRRHHLSRLNRRCQHHVISLLFTDRPNNARFSTLVVEWKNDTRATRKTHSPRGRSLLTQVCNMRDLLVT